MNTLFEELKDIHPHVHPLNKQFTFSNQLKKECGIKQRKENEIRVLTINLQMIPYVVILTSSTYPSCNQDERLLDIVHCFKDYDVVAIQECFGGLLSDTREKFIAYFMKAGFIYYV